jgi:hypothetical protein
MKQSVLSVIAFLAVAALLWSSDGTIQPYRHSDLFTNEEAISSDPMKIEGLDFDMTYLLKGYYQKSLGGAENWEQVQSLFIRGKIVNSSGNSIEFINLRKKPDLNKLVVYVGKEHQIISCYNGIEAWQHQTFEGGKAEPMALNVAVDFIRDSWFGGHLLYPMLPGKRIERVGNAIVDGEKCALVKVTLPNGQYYTISLDSNRYQRAEETVSAVDGSKRYSIQSDFQRLSGVILPFKSQIFQDDVLMQEIIIDSVVFNKGVMPWMFNRPE